MATKVSKVGKPLAFKTVKELQDAVDDYFSECDNRIKEVHSKEGEAVAVTIPEPYTMAGLAYALGVSRQTLINYENKDEYLDTIKKARARVERDVERRLMEGQNQTGAIFNLKNNFGWKDKTETDITSKGQSIAPKIVSVVRPRVRAEAETTDSNRLIEQSED